MKGLISRVWLFVALCIFSGMGHAVPETGAPESLQQWEEWVLFQHKNLSCPRVYNNVSVHSCRWPSELKLDIHNQGVKFTQQWQIFSEGWVRLPGNQKYWPTQVMANNKTILVSARKNMPAVFLPEGRFTIKGVLQWDALPSYLQIPTSTGLISATLNGRKIDVLNIDQSGKLWLGDSGQEQQRELVQEDSVSVKVYRKVVDGIPLTIETELNLVVSGRDREILLGQFLLQGMEATRFDSPLPARIEADGRLRIQVRAGEWRVSLSARQLQSRENFSINPMDNQWPEEEVWVFQAQRHLRTALVAGAPSIDPSQVDIPSAWEQLPAYLMQPDTVLTITEQYRGDASPTANDLTIGREFWLDFDGEGLTVKDHLNGTMNQGWRLTMLPGYKLGRAEVNGQPQLITQRKGEPAPGIEIRDSYVDVSAVSRFELQEGGKILGTSGWQHEFSKMTGKLHLPPGWLLLHASGVDTVSSSWLSKWNLWKIFVVLIIAVTLGRLVGWQWGALGAVTLLFIYHTSDSPVYSWFNLAVVLALLSVIPEGRFRKLLNAYLSFSFVVLALICLNFSIEQIRQAIYPQLERSGSVSQYGSYDMYSSRAVTKDSVMLEAPPVALEEAVQARPASSAKVKSLAGSAAPRKNLMAYDASAQIQTGPGEPNWRWEEVRLYWSGPVMETQALQFYLLPPLITRVLNFIKVAMVLLLAYGLLRFAYRDRQLGQESGSHKAGVLGLLPILCFSASGLFVPEEVKASEYPSEALLQELEERLTKLPECSPVCASLNKGRLIVDKGQLRIELQVDVIEQVGFPLPAKQQQWLPSTVMVNGVKSAALKQRQDGVLMIALPKGRHQVVLLGQTSAYQLDLPFEFLTHNFAVESSDWSVSGLVKGQIPGKSLQLSRSAPAVDGSAGSEEKNALLPEPLAPFVIVSRTLVLGLEWQLHTVVQRIAPQRGPINLQVPLLKNERIITNGIQSQGGKVSVVMSAGSQSFSWRSALKPVEQFDLQAADTTQWVEHWQLQVSPVWHVQAEGLNPVKLDQRRGSRFPKWQPWPGEKLALTVTRPEAVSGAVNTVEHVALTLTPGKRASHSKMEMDIRSSQGGEYEVTLPSGARLQNIVIDGVEQTNPQEQESLKIPLHPGVQKVVLQWKQDSEIAYQQVTPEVSFGTPLNNIQLQVSFPRDRWPLLLGGPSIGPAMLFWGVLVVVVLVAAALGMSGYTPVKTWQWLLLGLGMSTVNSIGSIVVAIWFFAMTKRGQLSEASVQEMKQRSFNAMQILLVVLTGLAMLSLIATIPMSLLSTPNMQITGNGSYAYFYNWYQDHSASQLPQAWVLSLPMWIYRLIMLLWSLWLVFFLLKSVLWGWQCFSAGKLWRKDDQKADKSGEVGHVAAND